MFLIKCPYCEEERPELEFTYAGEAHIARPENPDALNDEEWKKYLFIRQNARGLHYERWLHAHGCARFFNAVRHTVTDKFVMTYKSGLPRPSAAEITQAERDEADA